MGPKLTSPAAWDIHRRLARPAPAALRPIAKSGFITLSVVLLLAQRGVHGTAAEQASEPGQISLPFPVGEELVYRLYWGGIPVGKTRIVTRWVAEDGRPLLAIRYRTRSNRVIDKLYPVDDVIEAIVDPTTFLPLRFKIVLKEGTHRRDEITRFDHQALVARWESRIKHKSKEFPIEADTRDLVTFMYSMRGQRFQSGSNYHFRVMADDKIYDLHVAARGYEAVTLPTFGAVNSLRLDPTAAFQGLFIRRGKMTVWISQDERNLCTKVTASVPFISITTFRALLAEVHGPGDDVWIQKTREQRKLMSVEEEDPEVEKALRELDEEQVGP